MFRPITHFLLLATTLLLTACGGGGGSSSAVISGTTYTMTDLVLSPNTISGSTASSNLSIQVRQQTNGIISAFSGATVTFTSNCITQGKASIGTVLAAANGTYSATYTNNGCSGVDTISANAVITGANLNPVKQDLTITDVVQTLGDLTITTANTNVPADGVTQTAIRVQVTSTASSNSTTTGTTSNANPMSGVTVTFATNKGVLSATTAVTDKDGYASVYLTSSTQAGQATITASANGFIRSTSVSMGSLTPPARLIVTADSPIQPNGSAIITALALDNYGQPVTNANLIFEADTTNRSGGKLLSYSATTNVQGIASIIYQAGASITDTYNSTNNTWVYGYDAIKVNTSNNITQTANIRVANYTVSDNNPSSMALSLGGTDAPADNVTQLLTYVALTNTAEQPLSDVVVTFSSTLGNFISTTATTDVNGIARAYLTSATAGTATITASAAGFVRMTTVNFTPSTNTGGGGTSGTAAVQLGTYNGSSYTAGTIQAASSIAANSSTTLTFNLFNTSSNTAYSTDASSSIKLNSNCALMGKATISTASHLGNGVYSAIYTDNGCSLASDTVSATATINYQSSTATASFAITPLTSATNIKIGSYNGSNYIVGTLQAPTSIVPNGSGTLTFNLFNTATTPYTAYTTDASSNISFSSNCMLMGKAAISTPTYLGNGVYTVTYSDKGCSGSDSLSATATVNGQTSNATASFLITPASNSNNIKIGSYNGSTYLAGIIQAPTSIAPSGSGTLTFNLFDSSTTPYTAYTTDASSNITFSSNCLLMGKAAISTPTYLGNGVYTVTYSDKGCSGSDTITATAVVSNQTSSATATLSISAATSNSTIRLGYFDGTTFIPNLIYAGGNTNITTNTSTTLRMNLWDTTDQPYTTDVSADFSFSAPCQLIGKASISAAVAQGNGVYTATYTDAGCTLTSADNKITAITKINGQNTNTASVNLGAQSSGTLPTDIKMGSCTDNTACSANTFTKDVLKVIGSPLSAGGQTTVSGVLWDVNNNSYHTALTSITLTSVCASATPAKASISNTTAHNGQFSAIYKDLGCASTDIITATATVDNLPLSALGSLVVGSDTAGSIQFLSATPSIIAIKGSGTPTVPEQSTIKFKVVGANTASPVNGAAVTFALTTTAGGITINPVSATTDANGEVTTTVSAGTTPTPVRVIATSNGVSTQSSQLSISTTLPDQPHFSMGAANPNPMGAWDIQGTNTTITVLLADQFSNPPPAGTVVNFRAESGQITPTCSTDANGSCTVTWTTQTANNNPPLPYYDATLAPTATAQDCYDAPTSLSNLNNKDQGCSNKAGRVTIMAWVLGSEGFIDNNNNGIFDDGDNLATTLTNVGSYPAYSATVNYSNPPNSLSDYFYFDRRDLEPPYLDANFNYVKETGAANSGIPNEYEVPDAQQTPSDYKGVYNGVLCSRVDSACSGVKSVYIFRNMEIVMPTNAASILFWNNTGTSNISGTTITSAGTYTALIQDANGNTPASGANIAIAASATAVNLTVSVTPSTIIENVGYGTILPFEVNKTDTTLPATGSVEVSLTSGGVITTRSISVSIP